MTATRSRHTLMIVVLLLALTVVGFLLWGAGNKWHRPDIIRWGQLRR